MFFDPLNRILSQNKHLFNSSYLACNLVYGSEGVILAFKKIGISENQSAHRGASGWYTKFLFLREMAGILISEEYARYLYEVYLYTASQYWPNTKNFYLKELIMHNWTY